MTLLEKHYSQHKEERRLETRHGQVEFAVTWKFIHDFLPRENHSSCKIADIGAGTGKYSVALAAEGFDVTAVEPVKRNLTLLEKQHTKVKCWQGNALDLSFLTSQTFDVVLLLGPLYHLHSQNDKLTAFDQTKRILKTGGLIFAGYLLNDYSILSYCFDQNRMADLMERGKVSPTFHVILDDGEPYDYVRLEEIDALKEKTGLKRRLIFSPDGPSDFMRAKLNAMSDKTFALFVKWQMQNATRYELLGAGSHVVDVLEKR